MSLFEVNKIIAAIIFTLVAIYIINKIGNIIINPKTPEEQAYKIEIPETEVSSDEIAAKTGESNIEPISLLLKNASLEKGEKLASKCSACHNFKKGEAHKIGPNLFGIIDRPIGTIDGFAYSSDMATFGDKWTYENLANFLYKPKDYIRGTKMNFVGLKKVEDRANMVLWLRENSDNPPPLP